MLDRPEKNMRRCEVERGQLKSIKTQLTSKCIAFMTPCTFERRAAIRRLSIALKEVLFGDA